MKCKMMIGMLMLGAAMALNAGTVDASMLMKKWGKVQDGVFTQKITNNKFAHLMFNIKEANEPGKVLNLEYRVISPAPTAQFAVRFQTGEKWTYKNFPPKAEWTKLSFPFSQLRYESKWKSKTPEAGVVFTTLHLYGRNDTPTDIELQVRNISIDQAAK